MADMSTQRSAIVRHLELQARKLRLDAEAARQYLSNTDIGNVGEHMVRQFLASVLPARYAVGVGEAITFNGKMPRRLGQSEQKDVLIYDQLSSTVLGWGDSGVNLVPVESIYGVIEVKLSADKAKCLKAVDQALEVKKLCQESRDSRNSEQRLPFTGVFVYDSAVGGETLFEALKSRPMDERVDCVLILNPKDSSSCNSKRSYYFAHLHYYTPERGSGPIDFVSVEDVPQDRERRRLTFGADEYGLMWFCLLLIRHLEAMQLDSIERWLQHYLGGAIGWRGNE